MEISLRGGKLMVVSIDKPKFTLKQLFARVTEENLHHEIDSGPTLGDAVW
jgi:antitoxin component of MazEF toxin-antitoxin module